MNETLRAPGWFPALPRREPRGRGCRSICGRAVRPDVQRSDPSSLAGAPGYHWPERAAKMTAWAPTGLEFLCLHAESQGSVEEVSTSPLLAKGPLATRPPCPAPGSPGRTASLHLLAFSPARGSRFKALPCPLLCPTCTPSLCRALPVATEVLEGTTELPAGAGRDSDAGKCTWRFEATSARTGPD